jgi:hypothetical protein
MADNQVQTDQSETTVTDPLDAVNSTLSGTQENELAAYEAEKAALLASTDESGNPLGGEPAETDEGEQAEEVAEEEAAEEEQEEEEPEVKDSMRPRLKDPMDIAVATLAKAKGISLIEASRIIEGATPTTKEPDADKAPVETVASVMARIEELETLEAESSEALEFITANQHRKEANKLRNRLIDLKISEVQEKSSAKQAAEQQFLAEYETSQSQAVQFYPDAEGAFDARSDKAKTPLALKMIELDAQMRELGDPLFHSQKKPMILARNAALELGIPMVRPGTAQVKKPVQTRPMQLASGNARTTAVSPVSALEKKILDAKNLDEYNRALGRD